MALTNGEASSWKTDDLASAVSAFWSFYGGFTAGDLSDPPAIFFVSSLRANPTIVQRGQQFTLVFDLHISDVMIELTELATDDIRNSLLLPVVVNMLIAERAFNLAQFELSASSKIASDHFAFEASIPAIRRRTDYLADVGLAQMYFVLAHELAHVALSDSTIGKEALLADLERQLTTIFGAIGDQDPQEFAAELNLRNAQWGFSERYHRSDFEGLSRMNVWRRVVSNRTLIEECLADYLAGQCLMRCRFKSLSLEARIEGAVFALEHIAAMKQIDDLICGHGRLLDLRSSQDTRFFGVTARRLCLTYSLASSSTEFLPADQSLTVVRTIEKASGRSKPLAALIARWPMHQVLQGTRGIPEMSAWFERYANDPRFLREFLYLRYDL